MDQPVCRGLPSVRGDEEILACESSDWLRSFVRQYRALAPSSSPSHIGIAGNEQADAAANKAAQLAPLTSDKLPYTDLKQTINVHFNNCWQQNWSNNTFNKLYSVKPTLGKTTFKNVNNRKDETVLHRIRIGHTYLTHNYLLREKTDQSVQPANVH